MIDYTWADWLEALSTTIAQNGERYLAERARAVDWGRDDVPLLAYGDENIDPMSFLYFLAQRNTTHQFAGIFGSVHEVFDITLDFPESRPFIPAPTANTKTLFHDGNSFRPELLWRLFRQAAPIHERPIIQPEDFNAVLELPNVGMSKLTQTLFIANPCHYLPADRSAKGHYLVIPNSKERWRIAKTTAIGWKPSDVSSLDVNRTKSISSSTRRVRILLSRKRPISFRSAPMHTMTIQTTGNKPVRWRKTISSMRTTTCTRGAQEEKGGIH